MGALRFGALVLALSTVAWGSMDDCRKVLALLPGESDLVEPRVIATGRFKGVKVTGEVRTTTRGKELVRSGDPFSPADIDFDSALQHLRIHTDGKVAGGQFKGFGDPKEIVELLKAALPDKIQYDQFGRAEITLQFDREVGFTGVLSLAEIRARFPEAKIVKKQRNPGGTPDTVDGVKGAWFPEMVQDANKRWVVKMDGDRVANPKFKFEPDAYVAEGVEAAPTNKITLIVMKGRDTGRPTLVTTFPGDNAPAMPAKIDAYKVNTIGSDSVESKYWEDHAFLVPK